MKQVLKGLSVLLIITTLFACSKTSFINSRDATINFSSDTLHFDTVFTTTGSVTQQFKIFNSNNQRLRLTDVRLAGGSTSPFRLNVDGTPGVNFSNIEIEPNDSVYVFVSVKIDPSTVNLPFIVQDSILVNYNGNNRFIQLQAFGQNANFLRNIHITKDTVWKADLPFVIIDRVTVDSSATLLIEKGAKIYSHADAPFLINGTLKINGDLGTNSKVTFSGDRLDPEYRDLPGAWPGIFFSASSRNNVLNYAVIKNAYQGIITESAFTGAPKITLTNCIIDNIYDAGIISVASTIKAFNCLITNCGSNIAILGGGIYSFTHCTVATIGNLFINHKSPVLSVTNAYENQTIPLSATFTNSIFYGEGGIAENEIIVDKKGSPTAAEYNVVFQNVLYKNKIDQPNATFTNQFRNVPPLFDSIDAGRRFFDFHLKQGSPAIDAGSVTSVKSDLDGKTRDDKPDLGCYEH